MSEFTAAAGGRPDDRLNTGMGRRCGCAHPEDVDPCEGAVDAVRVVDRAGGAALGCVRHAAVLLASLDGGRVFPGSVAGAATEAFQRAQQTRPVPGGPLAQVHAPAAPAAKSAPARIPDLTEDTRGAVPGLVNRGRAPVPYDDEARIGPCGAGLGDDDPAAGREDLLTLIDRYADLVAAKESSVAAGVRARISNLIFDLYADADEDLFGGVGDPVGDLLRRTAPAWGPEVAAEIAARGRRDASRDDGSAAPMLRLDEAAAWSLAAAWPDRWVPGVGLARLRAALDLPAPPAGPAVAAEVQQRLAAGADAQARRDSGGREDLAGFGRPAAGSFPDLPGCVTFYGVRLSEIGEDGDVVVLGHAGRLRVVAAVRAWLRHCMGSGAAADAQIRWGLRDGCLVDAVAYRHAVVAEVAADGLWRLDCHADADAPGAFPVTCWSGS